MDTFKINETVIESLRKEGIKVIIIHIYGLFTFYEEKEENTIKLPKKDKLDFYELELNEYYKI